MGKRADAATVFFAGARDYREKILIFQEVSNEKSPGDWPGQD